MTATVAGAAAQRLLDRAGRALKVRQNPRTGQKVRRCSRHHGERDRRFWQGGVTDPNQLRALVEAAKIEAVATKAPGKRVGSIGRNDIAILELLAAETEWGRGEVAVAYRWMALKLRLSVHCVWRCLKRLKAAGFIDWIRRTQPVDDGTGRTVEQIENAYRIEIPSRWASRVAMRVRGWVEGAARAALRWRDDQEDAQRRRDRKEQRRREAAQRLADGLDPAGIGRALILDDLKE